MQIERNEIRVFAAVVEEGGFSRAAERLHVSQSAVSQAVANLEHKLDTRLLLRRGQPRLTEAGKPLVPEVIALALGFRCTRSSQSVQIAGPREVAVQIARG